jgi:hypothetical protein
LSVLDSALVRQDQELLDGFAQQPLSDAGLIDCCRLIMRYENSGGHTSGMAKQAQDQLEAWGLERRDAFRQSRKLWMAGYRPQLAQELVGSGADAIAAGCR